MNINIYNDYFTQIIFDIPSQKVEIHVVKMIPLDIVSGDFDMVSNG